MVFLGVGLEMLFDDTEPLFSVSPHRTYPAPLHPGRRGHRLLGESHVYEMHF